MRGMLCEAIFGDDSQGCATQMRDRCPIRHCVQAVKWEHQRVQMGPYSKAQQEALECHCHQDHCLVGALHKWYSNQC